MLPNRLGPLAGIGDAAVAPLKLKGGMLKAGVGDFEIRGGGGKKPDPPKRLGVGVPGAAGAVVARVSSGLDGVVDVHELMGVSSAVALGIPNRLGADSAAGLAPKLKVAGELDLLDAESEPLEEAFAIAGAKNGLGVCGGPIVESNGGVLGLFVVGDLSALDSSASLLASFVSTGKTP